MLRTRLLSALAGLVVAGGANAATPASLASIDQIGAGRAPVAAFEFQAADPGAAAPNVAELTSNATGTAAFDQTGRGEMAIVVQTGAGDTSLVAQSGASEYARVTQSGDDDYSSITQMGMGNQAFVTQRGDGARSVIVQNGVNNIATVRQ